MLFQHINRHADKHRKRVYLVLVAVIGLSFVVWVTPRGCILDPSEKRDEEFSRAVGWDISRAEFVRAYEEANLARLLDVGDSLERLGKEEAIDYTIHRLQVLRQARQKGFIKAVSDDEFFAYVKSRPVFQTAGVFDKTKMDQNREAILRRWKISGKEFDDILRANIAVKRAERLGSQ